MPHRPSQTQSRDPDNVQAWLVGGGIASIAAAVYLIKEANVPPTHIHILDVHSSIGGGVVGSGDATTGYVLHSGQQFSFHDTCTESLLSLVPSTVDSEKTLLDEIKDFNVGHGHRRQEKPVTTRILVEGESGPEKLEIKRLGISLRDRLELMKVMIESEHALERKIISDIFSADFFKTNFWIIWATTFAFQPWHSALEFRRYLRKFIHDVPSHFDTQYSPYESIIVPLTNYLESEGVDFRLGDKVIDILTYPDGDPTTVSEIKFIAPDGSQLLVTVDPIDLVIVTLGSVASGSVLGTNTRAPPRPESNSSGPEGSLLNGGDWSLWSKLSHKNHKFGNPSNFSTRIEESQLETFTITFNDSEFFDRFVELTRNQPGTEPVVSFPDSNWLWSINVPLQPVFKDQPDGVHVLWGYALRPEREGNYVKKPMLACSGEEILTELLQHLHFPLASILGHSITIPCVMPAATAPFLTRRAHGDRPNVIPRDTTNLGLVGQFVEIPDETTLGMEYSVRGAQVAVFRLMGLAKEVVKPKRNHIVEFLDLLT